MQLKKSKINFLVIWSVAACLFHLYTAGFGILEPLIQRSIHLLFILPFVFIIYPTNKSKKNRLYLFLDATFVILTFVCLLYILIENQSISKRLVYLDIVTPVQLILGTVTIFLVVEATRRAVSPAMTILTLIFLLYVFIGPHLSGMFQAPQIKFPRFIEIMYLFQEAGVFGILTGVSSVYIFIFVLFATLIETIGIGRLFINISHKLSGNSVGGDAKVAVVSSALFGSISGVATANVYATGSFTIPMMKKKGYNKSFAGAVEAAASTGGLILPPVMGVGAFVIAELTGNTYLTVCKAAILPAILYYMGIYFTVHFYALKGNIQPAASLETLSWKIIFKDFYLFIPILVLLICLLMKYTAFKAAYFSILSSIGIIFLRKETRSKWSEILINASVKAFKNSIMVGIACTCAGILVAVTTYTGIGVEISSNLVKITHGNFLLSLFVIMISVIILGMGLPCTPAYIIAVAVGGPALLGLGASLLPAHLFVYYFAILAAITPPVCMASYAAASIAEASSIEVGFKSMKLAFAGFLVPYIFISNKSALLLQFGLLAALIDFILCSVAVLLFALSFVGYFKYKLSNLIRLILCSVAVFIVLMLVYR